MRIKMVVIMVFALGCEELGPVTVDLATAPETKSLWIDDTCSDVIVESTKIAIDKLNVFAGVGMVILEGFREVDDHSERHSRDDNTIVCYYDEVPDTQSWYGYAWTDCIDLYLFKYEMDRKKTITRLLMHELFHFLGIVGHIDNDQEGIMSAFGSSSIWEYTEDDADFFCEFFDCI